MEDVADGLQSAWKETLQGLKVGYRKAKTVLKIPSTDTHTPDGKDPNRNSDGFFSHNDRRRLFQAKYVHSDLGKKGTSSSSALRRHVEESDTSSYCDSADPIEGLSDEEVKGLVECKFFDPAYDPVVFEIEHLPQECPKSEEAIRAESGLIDQKILSLRQQCDVVSTTLKKRVLAHHEAFVDGIEQLRCLNDSLLVTSSDCKKCRHAIRKAKESTVNQLRIIALKRGLDNCSTTVRVLEAMKKMNWKRMQLHGLLRAGKIVDASLFLMAEKVIDMEDVLKHINCMKEALEEWRSYVRKPEQLRDHLEIALKNCFTQVFIKDTYLNVVESAYEMSSSAECCSTVETLLWETAVQILTRSLVTMSPVKDEGTSLDDIVAGIEPGHLVMCFVSMAAKLIDFLYVFKTVYHLHEEIVKSVQSAKGTPLKVPPTRFPSPGSAGHAKSLFPSYPLNSSQPQSCRSPQDGHPEESVPEEAEEETTSCMRKSNAHMVHSDLFLRLSRLGPRLARDLILKIRVAISGVSSSSFCMLKVDQIIHVFVVIDLLIESMVIALRADSVDTENTRKELLEVLSMTIRQHFSFPRLDDLVQEMCRDPWTSCDISVSSLTVCKGLHPHFYADQLSRVHHYLRLPEEVSEISRNNAMEALKDGRYVERGDNPFQVPPLLEPQDPSKAVECIPFGHYWASAKVPAVSDANQKTSSSSQPSITMSENDLVVPPPTIIAASAVHLYRHLLKPSQLELVLRFPPLVERVMGWCEEWVSFYIFTVVDNFISISRSIPVEEQGDFSIKAQKTLRSMRQSAESAVDAKNGMFRLGSGVASFNSSSSATHSNSATPSAAPTSTGGGATTGILSQILHTAGAGASSPTVQNSASSNAGAPTLKFPPRIIDRIRTQFVSQSSHYALSHRVAACESARALVALHECVLRSFQPLFSSSHLSMVGQRFLDRCKDFNEVAVEGLHVCLHRLSEALLPMTKVCDEISHLKPKKSEVEVSSYVMDVIYSLMQLHQECIPLPTPVADTLLVQHSIFAAQCILVREYSKLSKKMNDMLAMQLQVDSQNFSQQAAAKFGPENVVRPRHILTLIKTGFFLQDTSQSVMWMEREHTMYNAADMLNWLSGGDRNVRAELEVKLRRDLLHVDCLPLSVFFSLK